ncbi:MAG: hypothetical protein BAJALOKI1v1_160019 [Promethearchaeota archaeon]|nr:MAG: hypothetical protein BAJALOKI1v1_160019 [Candidatus Lokiarchaeota archaeon]
MNVWVLDARSGITLVYLSYQDLMVNEDLVSGLLTALNKFTVFEFKQGIESIEMGGLRWVYLEENDANLLFIAADNKDVGADMLKARLNVIKQTFIKEYVDTNIFDKDDWNGNTEPFEPFKTIIDEYYRQWKKAESITTLGEFFDILGIFQQVLNIIMNTMQKVEERKKVKILNRIENMFKIMRSNQEYQVDAELQKITFSLEEGFNIIDINPNKCDMMLVEKFLIQLVKATVQIIKNEMEREEFVYNFLEEYLFTYLLNNLNLLNKLNLDQFLLKLFLT